MMVPDHIQQLRDAKQNKVPQIKKKGTLDIGIVETTPVVWNNRLWRFEWIRNKQWQGYYGNSMNTGYYRFTDMETEEHSPPFALHHSFGCAHAEGDTMYVIGVKGDGGGNQLSLLYTREADLSEWTECTAMQLPEDWKIYNTSICRGQDRYILAIEIGAPADIAGRPFTTVFAQSDDMLNWELLDPYQYAYTRERYSACPTIRYVEGCYYMIYLEGLPGHRWVPYIVRSADLLQWELGLINPVMLFGDEDKQVIHPEKFTPEQLEYISSAVNCNNSDVDLCEWQGKTVILYSWGNQLGKEFLALAEYDGPLHQFLASYF